MNVVNLISGCSVFSKPSLYIWNFLVHVLLKPNLKGFEHNLVSMWNEYKCAVVETLFSAAFLWDWYETDLLQSYCYQVQAHSVCHTTS